MRWSYPAEQRNAAVRKVIGRARLAEPHLESLATYAADTAAARIPHAQLVEFPDLGHAPQIQAPDDFHKALLDGIAK